MGISLSTDSTRPTWRVVGKGAEKCRFQVEKGSALPSSHHLALRIPTRPGPRNLFPACYGAKAGLKGLGGAAVCFTWRPHVGGGKVELAG